MLISSLGIGQQLGLPFSKYIGSAEYNSGMLNWSITQDQRGFMYFGNNFGLLEFDGSEWRRYPVRRGSKVRDVAISSDGRIYVGAQGDFGYFTANEIGDLIYFSLSEQLPDEYKDIDEVWKVIIGKNEIYFCTENNIFIYFKDVLVDVLAIEPTINFFYLNNRVYLQVANGGLYSLINGSLNEVIAAENLIDINIMSISPVPDNKFIMITAKNGIYDQAGKKIKTSLNSVKDLGSFTINCSIRLKNGNLALGTHEDGLFIYDDFGNLKLHLTKGSGLNHRIILAMMEDNQGNLWLAHNNGVSIVELSNPFSYINEDLGLPGSGYDAYSSGDDLYFATNNGLFHGDFSIIGTNVSIVTNTAGQKAYSINDFNGKLMLGHHNGSFGISGNSASLLNDTNGIWTFLESPKDPKNLIAGTYNGLQLYKDDDASWQYVTDINGFSESSRVMEFDEYGDLWMTHGYKGVYRIKLNIELDSILKVDYYGTNEGLPSQVLNSVYKIENELIFTTINGPYIFDYDNNRFIPEPILSKYELMNSPLNFMANDSKSNIYFIGQAQVGVLLKQEDGSFKANYNLFNKVKTLLNDDLQNISIINSTNVLFGAQEGFIVYNPLAISQEDNTFNIYLRNIIVSSEEERDSLIFAGNFSENNIIIPSQPLANQPELSFSYNSIIFSYSANFISDFEQTVYQHKLEGFEDHWSSWHTQSETGYTNLREGDYTLHVKAKNIYNTESIETTYKFTILAPWYRSTIAYTGYSAIILTTLLLSFVYIDRKYRKSKLAFETKKQTEVDEIGSKLKSLAEETTEEIDKLKSEKLQTEVDYKNAELASSTMNLINKNKFITHIKGNLTSISKKSKSNEVIKELGRINKEIDKNISHDDDWDQFTFHFNSVHGDFTTRLTSEFEHLSGQDIRLCSYLRLNLSTKEIAQLLNISVRGVEISRYRLRKKLLLERSINLSEFILNY